MCRNLEEIIQKGSFLVGLAKWLVESFVRKQKHGINLFGQQLYSKIVKKEKKVGCKVSKYG